MSRSLLRTINSLAKYENPKAPLKTQFLALFDCHRLSSRSKAFIEAADRFISYLLTYGHEVSIANRYFQPAFYKCNKHFIYFRWHSHNQRMFCSGCSCSDCKLNRFSSICPRFRIAWAIEHVTCLTNRILLILSKKAARVRSRKRAAHG